MYRVLQPGALTRLLLLLVHVSGGWCRWCSKKLTDEVEIREVLFDIYQDPSSRFHRSLNDKLKQLLQ